MKAVRSDHGGQEVLLYLYVIANDTDENKKRCLDSINVLSEDWQCQTATQTRRLVVNRGASLLMNEAGEHLDH